MFRVYVWIDGSAFDADKFQKTVGVTLGGTVAARKRMHDGSVQVGEKYWKSAVVQVGSGHPEDQLHELIERLGPELAKVAKVPGTRLVAELVEEVDDPDSVKGFFFPAETIQLLAKIGVSLDIDIVRRLNR